jgi:hypothetical protein
VKNNLQKVIRRPPANAEWNDLAGKALLRVRLTAIEEDGLLRVAHDSGQSFLCECLESLCAGNPLQPGDNLLAALSSDGQSGVVIGRVGRYRHASHEKNRVLEATDSLALKCGASSIELRADGKLLVKGEDVLVKARGTQRIKAGTVNIN